MIRERHTKDGKPYREVTVYNPATKKKEHVANVPGTGQKAERAAKKAEQDAAAAFRRQKTGALTLRELRPKWIAAKMHPNADPRPWKASTLRHNTERTEVLLAEFGDKRPDQITRGRAQEWAQHHPSCVDQAKSFLNWCKHADHATANPFEKTGISKGKGRGDDPPLTQADLERLLAACSVLREYADPFRGWILFQSYVGCRPAEGLGLERTTHIDVRAGMVDIVRQKYRSGEFGLPKNNRPRLVTLPDPARDALRLIPARVDSPWLFHNKSGDELLYSSMLAYWHTVCDKSGLSEDPRWPEGIDPYHLRHFCGSHLADLGVSAADIAVQLGHIDGGKLAMKTYIHSYEDNARARVHAAYRAPVATVVSHPRFGAQS